MFFYELASLMAKIDPKRNMVDLLILVVSHRASTFEIKEKARNFLAELGANFPAESDAVIEDCPSPEWKK